MFTFLLILQTLVAVAMISVILMQRSEGGGFAGGGSPAGMMSARGAADFLTRSTAILAAVFVILSIAIAAIAAGERGPRTIDPGLLQKGPPAGSPVEQQSSPFTPTAPAGSAQPNAAPAPAQVPAGNQSGGVPIAQ
ncbi:MAG TPA: preprotein translocase subunit SecG [Allosphingosinicella sp.]|nr:preprotein translocase subunit SecG [Allosphingosinicella sp.]